MLAYLKNEREDARMLLTAFKGKYNTSKMLLDGIHGDQIHKILLTNSFAVCEQQIRKRSLRGCRIFAWTGCEL